MLCFFWVPACAGMTGLCGGTLTLDAERGKWRALFFSGFPPPRERRGVRVTLTLARGGDDGVLCFFWVPACAGMTGLAGTTGDA